MILLSEQLKGETYLDYYAVELYFLVYILRHRNVDGFKQAITSVSRRSKAFKSVNKIENNKICLQFFIIFLSIGPFIK